METQRLLAHPIQNRDLGRRLARILSSLLVAAACQAPEVLSVLPDDASPAVSGGSFRAPTNVVATPTTFSRIDVTWHDASPNESGFQVFRSGASSGFVLVSTTAANIGFWSDSGLSASTQYCYVVRAFRAIGPKATYSDSSNVACATTPAAPPGAPSWTWAAPVDSATISLQWGDGSWDEDGFRVERSIDGGATWRPAATVAPDILSWTGVDPLAEQGPCYRVFAFNESGDSRPSIVRCAVPPAAPSNLAITVIGSGEIELTWSDNSAVEETYEVWVSHGANCCAGGCDAGWYEYPIAVLPANTTWYRTTLASSACHPISVFIMATKLGNLAASGYVGVPPLP
jgi:hypothetical protein